MQDKTINDWTINDWLAEWEQAIRDRDFAQGERLFDSDTCGFGTVTLRTAGLDDLIARQWREVWPRTADFRFERDTLVCSVAPDGLLAVLHGLWTSKGRTDDNPRRGRATLVLKRDSRDQDWRCIHTHFSMWPNAADHHLGAAIS